MMARLPVQATAGLVRRLFHSSSNSVSVVYVLVGEPQFARVLLLSTDAAVALLTLTGGLEMHHE